MSPLAKSAPSTMVGLDIGSDLIKIAEAKLVKDGIQITGLGICPTPPGTIENSIIVDPQGLGAAIKQLMKDSGIKTRAVVSCMSGQSSVVVRVIEVPRMTSGELKETMKWEVERHVPFSPTDIQMDFQPIEKPNTPPDSPNMEVLLAVAQQEAVDGLVKTMFAAGLDPKAIDVQALAISRPLIDMPNGNLPHVVGVVNIGSYTTDVGVYEGGLLTFPGPPLPIAGVNLTRAISEALGVPMDEAEMLKKEYAEVDLTAMQAGYTDDGTMYDMDGAPDQGFDQGPMPLGDSEQQPADDYSAFEFDSTPMPPAAPETPQSDISGEDVFDLGGGQAAQQDFTPMFDLDDPSAAPASAPDFDFDFGGDEPAADTNGTPTEQDATQPAEDQSPFESFDAAPTPNVPVDDMRSRVIGAISPVLMELAMEVRRSLDYYSTRYQMRPEQMFLCGGTARMRNLDQFLANELGIPVQVADPMMNLTIQCPKYTPQYLQDISPLFPVSIGLAIREMLE